MGCIEMASVQYGIYMYILCVMAHSAYCIVVTAVVVDVIVNVNIICVIKQKQSGKLTKSYGDYEHLNKVTLTMKVQFFTAKPAVLCVSEQKTYICSVYMPSICRPSFILFSFQLSLSLSFSIYLFFHLSISRVWPSFIVFTKFCSNVFIYN